MERGVVIVWVCWSATADDFVVLCRHRDRAEQARLLMAEILGTLGLQLHPDKTGIVHLSGGRAGFRLPRLASPQGRLRAPPGQVLPASLAQFAGHEFDPRADTPAHLGGPCGTTRR